MTPLLSCRASEALRRACPVLDTGESMKQMQKEKEVVISRTIWSFIARKSKKGGMKKINNVFLLCITAFIFITLMMSVGGCATVQTKETKDEISNLSFSHDGKKVLFDRCRDEGCQIQVYDLETGELAAYQSPANERWTMAKQSYDGKKIVFSVIPIVGEDLDLTQMQIGIMNTDGKNYKKLTSEPMPKLYPVFSNSGKKILYVKAGFMRKQGRTPSTKYDAWEMDIATGQETRLTYFEYFSMDSVNYFPGDDKIFYIAESPFAFPGLDLPKDDIKKALQMIAEEAAKRKVYLVGMLTIKKGDLFPERPYYNFEKGHPPLRPLLSRDGTKLYFEPGGKSAFYLYSPDGNHQHLGQSGGSVNSAAISSDGEWLGSITVKAGINIYRAQDGKKKVELDLPCVFKEDETGERIKRQREKLYGEKFTMIPKMPSRIINR